MKSLFVQIIESPSPKDLLENRRVGLLVKEGLKISGIDRSYCLAVDKSTFIEVLHEKFPTALKETYTYPFLHISAHGNDDGIVLTNGFTEPGDLNNFLKWDELEGLLTPINVSLNNKMIVCMSSCSGFSGCIMATKGIGPLPFLALIGPTENILIADLAIAFLTFYYRLSKGADVKKSIDAMKAASGNDNFESISASSIKRIYMEMKERIEKEHKI